jgi:hypothetical protein
MIITIRTKLSDEQRHSLLESLTHDKIGMIYDDTAYYIVASSLDSDALINALNHLQVPYDIVNNEEVVHNFRNRIDFKLAGNLDLFPLTFIPGL